MEKHNYHILAKDKEEVVLLYDCVKKEEYPQKYSATQIKHCKKLIKRKTMLT